MNDLISRQAAIDASCKDWCGCTYANCPNQFDLESERFCGGCDTVVILKNLPSAESEIIRCKDCKFYNQMNRETKTGICNLIMHQNFGDNWFCAGAERKNDE